MSRAQNFRQITFSQPLLRLVHTYYLALIDQGAGYGWRIKTKLCPGFKEGYANSKLPRGTVSTVYLESMTVTTTYYISRGFMILAIFQHMNNSLNDST